LAADASIAEHASATAHGACRPRRPAAYARAGLGTPRATRIPSGSRLAAHRRVNTCGDQERLTKRVWSVGARPRRGQTCGKTGSAGRRPWRTVASSSAAGRRSASRITVRMDAPP